VSAARPSREALRREIAALLKDAGVEAAALDARLLLCAALGISDLDLMREPEAAVQPDAAEKAQAFAARRAGGEPVSRITGMREFWGLSFELGEETLDPRPDSETLVDAALRHIAPRKAERLRLLDLGTGTGCLLLALLHELQNAEGAGVDVSPGAAAIAARNAARLGLSARAFFCCGSWDDAFSGRFDLLVSNPPYIPYKDIEGLAREVSRYDPHRALDGGQDGLDPYRRLFPQLPHRLAHGGIAVFEFGKGQEEALAALAETCGLKVLEIAADLAGTPRVIVVQPR